ncbi:MAG: pyruvate ferredoxin oxidoreductase subunit gamma [Dehalococcoidales bacterium]|nr:pyruvate ferredoxin oxidoreductase subunit gamma [Dehalococcoidales bacterium]
MVTSEAVKTELLEIRWHGRGGQGAVTSAELVAQAGINEGRYGQAFPSFGPERRGAPVQAFVRVSTHPIRNRAEITQPDVVVVLDPGLLPVVNVATGLKPDGIAIINTRKTPEQIRQEFKINQKIATVNATKIAMETLGVNIVNTTMVGALIHATGIVKLDSLTEPLKGRFGKLAERNFESMKKAFEQTVVKEKE